jgi:transcriptional regulator with XRE-family HTH domain
MCHVQSGHDMTDEGRKATHGVGAFAQSAQPDSPEQSGSFGARLRQLRTERGLLQSDLVGDGVSASYVSLLESGRRQPTAPVVSRLAAVLGVPTELLLTGAADVELREARLNLDYAELALRSGEAVAAHAAFVDVLARLAGHPDAPEAGGPGLHPGLAELLEQGRWGVVRSLEAQGRLEEALIDLEHLRETLEPASPLYLQAAITAARCSSELGDLHRAVDVAELALADARGQGLEGTSEHAELVSTLVGCYERRGDGARAAQLAEDLLIAADQLGNARGRAAAYWNASLLAQRRGHLDKAMLWAERAVSLLSDQDNERNLSRARVAFAWVLLRTHPPQVTRAVGLLRDAAVNLADHGTATDRAYAHTELSRALLMLGDPEAALAEATEAAALLSTGHRVESVTARLAAADAWAVTGDFDLARDHVGKAVESLAGLPPSRVTAVAWRHAADVLRRLGDEQAALVCLERALDQAGITAEPAPLRAPAERSYGRD